MESWFKACAQTRHRSNLRELGRDISGRLRHFGFVDDLAVSAYDTHIRFCH